MEKSILKQSDPTLASWIEKEHARQSDHLEMIASENFVSPAVLEAMGSVLTNKYAEGYPGKRYYSGCQFVDEVEMLAIERAKQLFGADYVNVQPHSGSQANMTVYFAFLEPGDKILSMDLSHGGHLTHGSKVNFSGKLYDVIHYGVDPKTHLIDYDRLKAQAEAERPKMMVCGASAYARDIDFKALSDIATSVGAYLLADIAHIAGLVATGLHADPIPYCDFVTTTTHKTLRGPRGGMVMAKKEHAKKLASNLFPGIQGGPMMHVIAGKAVAFGEALQPMFKDYCHQVIKNARCLGNVLESGGLGLVSGGTDNHLILVDLRQKGLTGKVAETALERAGITVNKNMVPFDTEKPFVTSGIRMGTPALTTRGMKEAEFEKIGLWILGILDNPENDKVLAGHHEDVKALASTFPLFQAS